MPIEGLYALIDFMKDFEKKYIWKKNYQNLDKI
jgi:hypothetical protein